MNRREFAGSLMSAAVVNAFSTSSWGAEDTFDSLLSQLAADPTLVENAWQYRDENVSRGIGRGTPSKRTLSPRVIDMIVRLEVASPQRYAQSYSRPIWPRGKSGVTIGIGYDLRYANAFFLQRDWGGILSPQALKTLQTALRLSGEAARQAVPAVHSVTVPWEAANKQFIAFLPYPTAQTEDAFPNTAALSADSFGALVSLVYNRGPGLQRNSDSRREMREIHDLMAARSFGQVPGRIRAMKRLWPDPNSRGLVIRRELEAKLFEAGMIKA